MSNIWIEIARGGKFERTEWNINSIWLKFRLSIIHGNIHVYILTWREWLRRLWLQIVLSWQHVYCVENPNCLKRVGETVSNPLARLPAGFTQCWLSLARSRQIAREMVCAPFNFSNIWNSTFWSALRLRRNVFKAGTNIHLIGRQTLIEVSLLTSESPSSYNQHHQARGRSGLISSIAI